MSRATDDLLADLHGALAKELSRQLKSGEANAALLGVVRQFLKDNGIDGVPAPNSPLANLLEDLPFDTTEGRPN